MLFFLKVDTASYVNVIINVYKNFIFAFVGDDLLGFTSALKRKWMPSPRNDGVYKS